MKVHHILSALSQAPPFFYMFLRYRDFRRSLQQVQEGTTIDEARKAAEALVSVCLIHLYFDINLKAKTHFQYNYVVYIVSVLESCIIYMFIIRLIHYSDRLFLPPFCFSVDSSMFILMCVLFTAHEKPFHSTTVLATYLKRLSK